MVREVELCRRFATWCKCWRTEAACCLVGRGRRSFWGPTSGGDVRQRLFPLMQRLC